MRKLGFGKKGEDGDDDNRRALFGSRSKAKSPAPQSNPYAQTPGYSDPYTEAKSKLYGNPQSQPSDNGQSGGPKRDYGGVNQPPNQMGGGYGPGKQSVQGGYGRDRYGGSDNTGGGSRYGPGGYGGLGNADPNAGDDNRNALFGDARQRFQERQQQQDNTRPPPYSAHAGAENESGAPGTTSGGYGAYQDRQLTAEEEEEEDVQAIKQEIRFMKQQDVSSTRNALRVAAEAEETGRSTLARLGAQGERIHNTEKNLDLAANQNRIADEKSRELKKLNKSMFAMHVSNPFTSAERRRARDEAIISRHRDERFQREETRLAAFRTEQRLGQTFKEMEKQGHSATSKTKTNLAERSKYQFEQDSEDDEMENEIDSNLDALHGAAVRLNGLARATGRELEEQNKRLDVIMGKSDSVDDQIHMNRARLDRIR
ncbi:Protein transport protein S9 plasma membrane t-SNARE [Coccidioides posadasii str. Silveira]|uniref:Protein transport protein SEC9 n=1 Tax=Coccidioides posadasii (strain RMSCC 757 / Silveira) TaxID=443226 RepID=E9D9J0_COCPS|nr:plasma membrane SNARE protein [Coccidioides posadasii str. Silveira]QVM09298.1 Protein transport protein S9 plasma membrane t-SNARE [Coccidioides posadasii str. Silveira]